MNKSQMNLQDLFLNQVRKENVPVTIYLVAGVQLKGMVRGFDAFTVVLETPGKPAQLIYKHAMASVVPLRPVNLRDIVAERQQAQAKTAEAAAAAAPAAENAPEPAPAAEEE